MKRTSLYGALSGALAALIFLAASAGEIRLPQWEACAAANDVECARGGDDTLSYAEWRDELGTVFQWTGRAINYRADAPGKDEWFAFTLPVAGYWLGDCEDYALTLRRKMIELGAPADAMRIVTLWDGSALHAALTVWTHDAGVKVYDMQELYRCGLSQCPAPKVWDYADYIARPDTALIFIYDPAGNFRPAAEGWLFEFARRAIARVMEGGV